MGYTEKKNKTVSGNFKTLTPIDIFEDISTKLSSPLFVV